MQPFRLRHREEPRNAWRCGGHPVRGKRVGRVWRIQFVDADGKYVTETIGAERDGVTEKRAREVLADRLSDVRRKGYRRPKAMTFRDFARQWFEQGEQRRGWKPNTVRTHGHRLEHLNRYFGAAQLGAIRPSHVAEYIQDGLRKRAARSVIAEVNLLHDILGSALAEEAIPSNPVTGVERPKARPNRWRVLEPEEVRRVAAAFTDDRARAVFLTLHLTGLRRHELQSLRWGDVSLIEGTLRVVTPEASELLLMATAGHRSFATTRKYLHLAGRTFPAAAAALEDRLLAGELSTPVSTPPERT